ncbi:hypothetical protein EB796_023270 [Bugula neritina]|uniref:Uncharacterized protein n=1 Tax=Bugula neritina TaxID=10212 RepID=A0A7J7IYE3_BUGNE|nr:hypothetical protein EB796_023270 [Bugula neritina]
MAAAGASKAARSAADKQAATEKRTSTRESSSAATNLCEEATSSSQPTPQGRVTSPAPSMQSSTGKPPEPISTEDAKTATPTSAKLLGNDYNILVTDEEYPSKIQDKEFNYDEQSRELSLKVIKDKASAHESSSKKKHLISQIAEPHSEKTSNIHNFSSGDGVALNSLVQQMKLMRAELYDIRQHIARLITKINSQVAQALAKHVSAENLTAERNALKLQASEQKCQLNMLKGHLDSQSRLFQELVDTYRDRSAETKQHQDDFKILLSLFKEQQTEVSSMMKKIKSLQDCFQQVIKDTSTTNLTTPTAGGTKCLVTNRRFQKSDQPKKNEPTKRWKAANKMSTQSLYLKSWISYLNIFLQILVPNSISGGYHSIISVKYCGNIYCI